MKPTAEMELCLCFHMVVICCDPTVSSKEVIVVRAFCAAIFCSHWVVSLCPVTVLCTLSCSSRLR